MLSFVVVRLGGLSVVKNRSQLFYFLVSASLLSPVMLIVIFGYILTDLILWVVILLQILEVSLLAHHTSVFRSEPP
jgi:hypothetical protein